MHLPFGVILWKFQNIYSQIALNKKIEKVEKKYTINKSKQKKERKTSNQTPWPGQSDDRKFWLSVMAIQPPHLIAIIVATSQWHVGSSLPINHRH